MFYQRKAPHEVRQFMQACRPYRAVREQFHRNMAFGIVQLGCKGLQVGAIGQIERVIAAPNGDHVVEHGILARSIDGKPGRWKDNDVIVPPRTRIQHLSLLWATGPHGRHYFGLWSGSGSGPQPLGSTTANPGDGPRHGWPLRDTTPAFSERRLICFSCLARAPGPK